ncbi:hypothetical protein [Synechocystis sp. PCC 7509]|uniref:hypothetical protein n=1 Tax=Synechocystis sp. PCC 7509 TaxID=927677 RepID=UPI0011DCAC18|nr:hypothetical protein [Synechocystis sp. PCC 7509]
MNFSNCFIVVSTGELGMIGNAQGTTMSIKALFLINETIIAIAVGAQYIAPLQPSQLISEAT